MESQACVEKAVNAMTAYNKHVR